jgi:hypothetical protein
MLAFVIPVFREYCAAKKEFTFMAAFVMTWMHIIRPFRLAYRILTVITGGGEVDRHNLTRKLTEAQQTVAQSQETITQWQGTIA